MRILSRFHPLFGFAAGLAVFAACTGGDLDDPLEPRSVSGLTPSAPDERIAIVSLTWRPGEPGLAQAYVVDHPAGQRKAALDMLGVSTAGLLLESSLGFDPTDGNLASPGLLADQCRVERLANDATSALLRDAGEILVATGDSHQVLDFTWLPEGSLGASGAAYSALLPAWPSTYLSSLNRPRPVRARTPPDRARPNDRADNQPRVVSVTADGSHEIGPFTASTLLPAEVHIRSVNGHAVRDGRVVGLIGNPDDDKPGASFELADIPPGGLELTWSRPSAPTYESQLPTVPSELTLVVFERFGFGETWTVSCATEDDGVFSIPVAALMALPDLGAYQTDRVVVRKIAGASFSSRDLPEGLLLAVSEDQAYLE
jgi:hypothetical protein